MDLSKYNDILQYVKNLFENDLQVLEVKQVILYGSATYPGCFDEITSDIDIIALVSKTDTRSLDDIVSLLANKMQNNMGYKHPLIIRDGAGERVEFSVVFRHTVIDCTIMKSLLPDYVEWQYSAVHDSVDIIIGSIVNKGLALIGEKANLVDSNLDIQPFYDDGLRAKRLKTLSTYLYKKVIRMRQLIKADNPEVIDYYFRYRAVFLKWLFCYLREYPVNLFKHLHFQLENMKDKMGESKLSQQEQSVIMLQSSDSIQESISNFLDLYEGFLYQYQHEDANSFKVAPNQTAPQSKARKMKDKELIQKLFGRYDVSNFPKIIKYMQEFDQKVKPYNNYGKPYFKGTPKFSFYEYLKNQQLNQTPEAIDTVFERLASFTQNLPNWNNPGTMINVVPPVNLASLSVVNYIQGLNSNFAQDTYAGFLITAELEVTKYISDLVGWNWQKSIGVFTFGGKGTSLYATKIALSKCDPDVSMYGCKASNYFILTSATAHPCHYEVCDWLGLGKNSCIEIPCLENGEINLLKTEKIICNELEKGKIFLGCNLNGGSTNELYIDPIKSVYNLISKISQKYKLTYRPHLHVDSVIGWVYLFFQNYDFTNNPLNINKNSLKKIHFLSNLAQDFKYADSMGIDFHKTGFCPYASSLFLCRERQDYFAMNPAKYQDLQDLEYGNYNPYHTTLELSRPATGAVTALVSLKTLGVEGFQQIYSSMFEASELFRKKLAQDSRVCIINSESCWLASLFILKPENYQNLNLDDIIALDDSIQQEIKNFNINFAKYIQQKACNSEINFVFTSSRSHVIPGTNISLGTLKAYPMSVFFDQYSVVKIIQELKNCIDDYITNYTNNDTRNITSLISDDMVYKEKSRKYEG